jgi:hypothetical protein
MRQPGDRIGRYVIVALLGRGGMGEVYEAEDSLLGRRVALKLISTGSDKEMRERMLREARTAAGLQHPNVVMVFDAGVVADGADEGEAFLAMELVRGKTLRSTTEQGSRRAAAAASSSPIATSRRRRTPIRAAQRLIFAPRSTRSGGQGPAVTTARPRSSEVSSPSPIRRCSMPMHPTSRSHRPTGTRPCRVPSSCCGAAPAMRS